MLTESDLLLIEGSCRGNLLTPPKTVLQLVEMVRQLQKRECVHRQTIAKLSGEIVRLAGYGVT